MILLQDTPALREIQNLITAPMEEMGYELVRLSFNSSDRPVLQIMADRTDDEMINVDDCAEISRMVSVLMDVEDPITGRYDLEVSSPGIDRPLTRAKDFEKYAGFDVKLTLKPSVRLEGFENRKRFSGLLNGLKEENVLLETEGYEFEIPFQALEKAKLVLTDELIKAHQKG